MYNKIYLAFGLLAAYLIFKNTSKKMSFIKPLTGLIKSPFGNRTHPVTGAVGFHNGIDIAAPLGTPIVAPADGLVKSVFESDTGGKQVIITHANNYQTGYAHLQRYKVTKGQKVAQGEVIGYVGQTGQTTGPHLHFNVKLNNQYVNPESLI